VILVDTDVLSSLMQERPDAKVVAWLDSEPRTSIWTTSVTVLEIRFGLEIMSAGKKRTRLFEAFDALVEKINHRIASFDGEAARLAAELMASRQKKGRPQDLRDTMTAAIALAHHATLATRNTSHFEDANVRLINPWG
jgi:toxin FitB